MLLGVSVPSVFLFLTGSSAFCSLPLNKMNSYHALQSCKTLRCYLYVAHSPSKSTFYVLSSKSFSLWPPPPPAFSLSFSTLLLCIIPPCPSGQRTSLSTNLYQGPMTSSFELHLAQIFERERKASQELRAGR